MVHKQNDEKKTTFLFYLFSFPIKIEGEGSSILGSRKTRRRGVRRNLRMGMGSGDHVPCTFKIGALMNTNIPGLVNEEKEPLEIAYRSEAEIDKIIDISQQSGRLT